MGKKNLSWDSHGRWMGMGLIMCQSLHLDLEYFLEILNKHHIYKNKTLFIVYPRSSSLLYSSTCITYVHKII